MKLVKFFRRPRKTTPPGITPKQSRKTKTKDRQTPNQHKHTTERERENIRANERESSSKMNAIFLESFVKSKTPPEEQVNIEKQ